MRPGWQIASRVFLFCIRCVPGWRVLCGICVALFSARPESELSQRTMINPDRLTVKATEALNEAIELARRAGNPLVYDLHLLLALLNQDKPIESLAAFDAAFKLGGRSPDLQLGRALAALQTSALIVAYFASYLAMRLLGRKWRQMPYWPSVYQDRVKLPTQQDYEI